MDKQELWSECHRNRAEMASKLQYVRTNAPSTHSSSVWVHSKTVEYCKQRLTNRGAAAMNVLTRGQLDTRDTSTRASDACAQSAHKKVVTQLNADPDPDECRLQSSRQLIAIDCWEPVARAGHVLCVSSTTWSDPIRSDPTSGQDISH